MAVISNGPSHSLPTLVGDYVPKAPNLPRRRLTRPPQYPANTEVDMFYPPTTADCRRESPSHCLQAPGAAMTGITGLMRLTKPNSHQGTKNQQATGRLDRRTRLSIRSSIRSSTRSTPISFDPNLEEAVQAVLAVLNGLCERGDPVYRVYRVYGPTLVGYGMMILTSGDPMLWYGKMAGMAQLSLPVCEIYYVGTEYRC